MKKVFFAIVAATVFVVTACNNNSKPAEGNATPASDTTVKSAVQSTATDTTAKSMSADSTSGSTGSTGK